MPATFATLVAGGALLLGFPPPVLPLLDAQELLVAFALDRDGNALDPVRQAVREIDVDQHVARLARQVEGDRELAVRRDAAERIRALGRRAEGLG